ncbi:MAG: hypothetical protein LW715_11335 [Rhodobacter sp.]|jgi:hypothetical protein|nr:hypothetical protein [Rhodobacter sp.]
MVSWEELFGGVEQVLTLTALAGVTYSAFEFVKGIKQRREAARKSEVESWLKMRVQEIIATSQDYLNVIEILAKLRSTSFDSEVDVKKNELTESSVRLLLIQMVSEGVVGQVWPDSYGIIQIPRDVSLPLAAIHIRVNFAVRQSWALIHEHPGRYTSDELYERVGIGLELSKPDFLLAISDLDTRGIARLGAGLKWTPLADLTEEK